LNATMGQVKEVKEKVVEAAGANNPARNIDKLRRLGRGEQEVLWTFSIAENQNILHIKPERERRDRG